MQLKFIQNIIDLIRGKEYYQDYIEMGETIQYLSKYIDFTEYIKKKIFKKYTFPRFHIKKDKKELQKFLNTIDAKSIPTAIGKLREHQLNKKGVKVVYLPYSKTTSSTILQNTIKIFNNNNLSNGENDLWIFSKIKSKIIK